MYEKPLYTSELTADCQKELSAALEPFFGLSTAFFGTANYCDIEGPGKRGRPSCTSSLGVKQLKR